MRAVYPYVKWADSAPVAHDDVKPGMTITWNMGVRFVVAAVLTTVRGLHVAGYYTNCATGVVETERTDMSNNPIPSNVVLRRVLR